MKLFKLCSVLCVTLCIVGLGIDLHVSASTGLEEKNRKVEEYVQQVQEHNEEVSLLNLEDIPATITLENNITYTQLSEYIADNNLETVQLQARGIDANGERVTFASKTYKGLFETDQMIKVNVKSCASP